MEYKKISSTELEKTEKSIITREQLEEKKRMYEEEKQMYEKENERIIAEITEIDNLLKLLE